MEIVIKIPKEEYKNICLMSKDGIGMALYDWIANGTPLDSIISQIEQARDKDKLCEYPYNRCIEIMRKAAGNED